MNRESLVRPFEPLSLADGTYEGFLDAVRRGDAGFELRGWFRSRSGESGSRLRFLIAGHEVTHVVASQFRWDLYAAGFGDACVGFSVVIPEVHLQDLAATVDLCAIDSDRPLASVALQGATSEALKRRFDWSVDSLAPVVSGWIVNGKGPSRVTLQLVVNKELVATFSPDIYRPDVHSFGGGPSGFEVALPAELNDGRLLEVELYLLDGQDSLLIGRELYSSGRAQSKKAQGLSLDSDLVQITGSEVAIVSTFSKNVGRFTPTARILNALTRAGLQVIVVDTSPEEVDAVTLLKEASPSVSVVRRENEGWDFGSWIEAIKAFKVLESPITRLLLTNDSYFATAGFDQTVRSVLQSASDITGVTDSLAHGRHLQSYLLSFRISQNVSRFLEYLTEKVGIQVSREAVIEVGELGLAGMAHQHGLISSAIFPYERLADSFVRDFKRLVAEEQGFGLIRGEDDLVPSVHRCMSYLARGVRLNPTHFFWRQMLQEGAGVIKRELIEKNPNRIDLFSLLGTLPDDDRKRLAGDLAACDLYLPEILCD